MFHISINHLIHDTLTIEAEFELKAGEITTLIGKSGSGKSSLLNNHRCYSWKKCSNKK